MKSTLSIREIERLENTSFATAFAAAAGAAGPIPDVGLFGHPGESADACQTHIACVTHDTACNTYEPTEQGVCDYLKSECSCGCVQITNCNTDDVTDTLTATLLTGTPFTGALQGQGDELLDIIRRS